MVLDETDGLPVSDSPVVRFVARRVDFPANSPNQIVASRHSPARLTNSISHKGVAKCCGQLLAGPTLIAPPLAVLRIRFEINGLTEYVVRVENQGTKAAENVALSAKLLGDLQPVEARGPVPYEVQNLMITFEPLASLAPADEAVFHVQVRGRRPGNQRVQFQLQSDDLQTPLTSEEMTHVYADR